MLKIVPIIALFYMGVFVGCGGGGATDSSGSGSASLLVGFDGARAMSLLTQQVAFGTRVPGTAPHAATRDFIIAELRNHTGNVTRQDFTVTINAQNVAFTNIIAVMPSATGLTQSKRSLSASAAAANSKAKKQGTISRLLIGAHWDTRPTADFDPDPTQRNQPIPGANDGASGVAVLLELARLLKARPARIPVELVFFDGEDFGPLETMFQGSKFFANNMGQFRPDAAVILDMIGDANLQVNRETASLNSAPDLYNKVLQAANDLGFSAHFNGAQMDIIDDHRFLIDKGIPSIDLIDFQYPDASHRFWHTLADTPDKCSANSLKVIGEVVLRVVYGL